MAGMLDNLWTACTWQVMSNDKGQVSGGRVAAVRFSPIHGRGLFALQDMAPGHHIAVYEGRRYAPDADRDWDRGLTYVFGLSDGTLIDGSEGGNESRHINHSCEPNCAAYEVERNDGSLDVVIQTVRSVLCGEELLLDYALDVGVADHGEFPCRCGVPTCKGTMVAA